MNYQFYSVVSKIITSNNSIKIIFLLFCISSCLPSCNNSHNSATPATPVETNKLNSNSHIVIRTNSVGILKDTISNAKQKTISNQQSIEAIDTANIEPKEGKLKIFVGKDP